MRAHSRTFTPSEILAMAGYQLDPGHSDLDNEQPMSVRLHDGLWDHVDFRCLLGDIRKAKADFYAGLRTALAASVLLEALKDLDREVVRYAMEKNIGHEGSSLLEAVSDARAAIAQAEAQS